MFFKYQTLTPGSNQKDPTPQEQKIAEDAIRQLAEQHLPEFIQALETAENNDVDTVMLHQDGFAAGYHTDEMLLLAVAVKYAGLRGMGVLFVGESGSTF